jgi:hypothetical protein
MAANSCDIAFKLSISMYIIFLAFQSLVETGALAPLLKLSLSWRQTEGQRYEEIYLSLTRHGKLV